MGDVINKLDCHLKQPLKVSSFTITARHGRAPTRLRHHRACFYGENHRDKGTPEQIRNTENPIVRQFVTGAEEGPFEVA
jgi:ABC-type transporter Mla maintaining outer membrane lipid asymmetry ATPase subunit MlaF